MTAAGNTIEKVQKHEDKLAVEQRGDPERWSVVRELEEANTSIIDRVMELREQADDKKFKNAGCVDEKVR